MSFILHSELCILHFFFGGHKAVVRPDPIPNSAVKHSLADGSGLIDSARVGCRQSFPKAETKVSAFFILLVLLLLLVLDLSAHRPSRRLAIGYSGKTQRIACRPC